MLTLVIKADKTTKSVFERHKEIILETQSFERDFNVVFLAHQDYENLQELKQIATSFNNHELFVCNTRTTDEEMTAMALSIYQNNDIILLTLSTNNHVLREMLKRRAEGYKIVRVKEKTNFFSQMFRVLGNWTYSIGLKMLGKKRDNFSESDVMFLESNIVSSICEDMQNTRENRITNVFSQTKHMTLDCKNVYENKKQANKNIKPMLSYGLWSFVFLLIFVALTSIYPFFYNFTYSWWMIVLIIFWVGFGLLLTFLFSKKVFYKRLGWPNRVNNYGEPLFGFLSHYEFGDEIKERKPLPKLTKPVLKNKIK